MFDKLDLTKEKIYKITSHKQFKPEGCFKKETIDECFNFAWDMTFGGIGEQRNNRSGGDKHRREAEIFINVFQGKLAEFGTCNIFRRNGKIKLDDPDLERFKLGEWDRFDFLYNNLKFSVKSTSHFGNLLLLETKDWTDEGKYIPNNEIYDYHILFRIKPKSIPEKPFDPDAKGLLRSKGILDKDSINKEYLYSIISSVKWEFEMTGYITNDDLKEIIHNKYIIPKGAFLNTKNTIMDAENFYIQSTNLRYYNKIFEEIK